GVLAIDPFLLTAVVLGAVAFRGRFRTYTVATIVFSFVMAIVGFSFVNAVIANEPTPWMGAAERAAQYATNLWYAVFAVVLLRERMELTKSISLVKIGHAQDRQYPRGEDPPLTARSPGAG